MADTEPGPPHRSDSQATTISLLRLDPTPIDSPDTESDRPPLVPEEVFESEDEDTYRSTERTAKPSSIWAPGLSGSGRGAVYYRIVSPFKDPTPATRWDSSSARHRTYTPQ